MSTQPKAKPLTSDWQPSDAAELYRIPSWGDPFFFVNEKGHMAVRALDEQSTTIDIVDVVTELRRRGIQFPVLLRFQDVLRAQVRRVNEAFRSAIAEANYGNVYRGIYPIKVNQLHEVVDELLDAGRPYGMGLECGSKAELIACLPHIDGETLLVCNGVKDRTMLSLMIAGQKLGQNIVPVMEKYSEFTDIKGLAFSSGYMSQLGVRVRLATRGAGRWAESSGTNSKFGLNIAELMRMVNELEASGQQGKLVLLHCHIGSQIADIQVLKEATKEVTQIYAQLVKRGIALKYLDVGGGLGVNYDKGHLEEDAGHQLRARGIRERGRVHGQGGLRRERGADADARHRERPRADGAPFGADRAGVGRERERRSESRPHGARERSRAAARAEQDSHGAAEDA